MKKLASILGGGLLLASFASQPAAQGEPRPGGISGLAAFEIQRIGGIPARAERFLLPLRLEGAFHVVDLKPRSMRSDDFRVLVPRGDGFEEYPVPPPKTLEGTIEGLEGSRVVGSIVPDGVSLKVLLADGRSYHVQPLSDFVAGTPGSSRHVVYRSEDAYADVVGTCGTDDADRPVSVGPEPVGPQRAVTGLTIFDVACEADEEYYIANGSSVAATIDDIEAIMNGVRLTYEVELDLTIELTTFVVRDTGDPYTSADPSTFLAQFRSEWNGNLDLRQIRRDVAHLFTDVNLVGSTIGIAYFQGICDSLTSGFGYGLSESMWTGSTGLRECLTEHELGHNWDASHCNGAGDCGVMCSGIGGCAVGCAGFSAGSTSSIASFQASINCLTAQQDPLEGMMEDFLGGAPNGLHWNYVDGPQVRTTATAEPSEPNSFDFNASGADPYRDDEARTGFIELGSATSPVVSYYTQHSGVEAGEELVVEYRVSGNVTWDELQRITSDGVDQTTFDFHEPTLPGDALHDEFRLRFRVEVDEGDDHWFVDNIFVGTERTITVDSSPAAGAAITVAPSDKEGDGDGSASFTRTYPQGISLTLTAAAMSGGLDFFEWELDTVSQGSNPELTFEVTGDRTADAVYMQAWDLDVTSVPTSASITVTPSDNSGQGSGSTPLSLRYFDGTMVDLTAPSSIPAQKLFFRRWVVDGTPQTLGDRMISVTMSLAHGAVAEYVAYTKKPPLLGDE